VPIALYVTLPCKYQWHLVFNQTLYSTDRILGYQETFSGNNNREKLKINGYFSWVSVYFNTHSPGWITKVYLQPPHCSYDSNNGLNGVTVDNSFVLFTFFF